MSDACRAILRALDNEHRLRILGWLKNPRAHIGPQSVGDFKADGVCVTLLRRKAGLSQSTTSEHLALLERAGLVRAKRVGLWTWYRRDEAAIRRFLDALTERLA
jgi:ArsR family transcriptional regulator